ncbi:barstar (barnase inhibitor) [Streptomyces sp. CG 926]|uniref:barstar family protein n=1 Tax=Streptomyces sp. CG 926 TaxID=1882405 RepID=UPI000D7ACCAB|nr:barstar family protein [Streptomyces sp. CG 926]PWK63926.1 barstar (barnase inhibitor) [Streptomyces sp. CG 926]
MPRELLTLRGCTPAGPWHDVLAFPDEATRSLGNLDVDISDEMGCPQFAWTLVDTVVISHSPNATDPGLVDVVVGTGVIEHNEVWPGADLGTMPAVPRFALAEEDYRGGPVGECRSVDGLLAPRKVRPDIPLQLIGCEPGERLLAALGNPQARAQEWGVLVALDRFGREMRSHWVRMEIAKVSASALGGSLVDITLADGGDDDRPSLGARRIWETWYQGFPTMPNQWASLDTRGRAEWLDLTRPHPGDEPDRTGGTHHLEGQFVTDKPGLYCALGEALIGPGRWFERGLEDLNDCLGGRRGVLGPFTLIWHDADVARDALNFTLEPGGKLTYFEESVRLLESRGVTVVLR